MRSLRSLRSRVLLGAVLWTLGLLGIAHIISTALAHRYPNTLWLAHWSLIGATAIGCLILGLSQVRRGLSPVAQLRARLGAMREGRDRRVEGVYPDEVQPLVNDLNALLDDRQRMVTQALAKAGDLAHGLKTPLAVLAQEAARAEAEGHGDLAATISHQVDRMRRQVDHHLAHARAAVSGATPGVRCQVAASAEGLSRTLLRLHAARGVTVDVHVSPDHSIRGQREDLDEMLGNLLDNACTWAATRVSVRSVLDGSTMVIVVDDDGPGLAAEMWEAVLQRGVRADEAAPGSGFGLAIVRELAEVYGGSIVLGRAPEGGLRARLQLPAG